MAAYVYTDCGLITGLLDGSLVCDFQNDRNMEEYIGIFSYGVVYYVIKRVFRLHLLLKPQSV